ncbi:MAG: NADH:ubiquinone reductase (Na(+)-transporting) subunit F [Pirellulales bacterium]|nr:NADH:ubiquinone reductase (Na(+)-transporting) subunit F [Pirellulales bacterium]
MLTHILIGAATLTAAVSTNASATAKVMQILTGVVMFTVIVTALVVVILVARRWLVPQGDVTIIVNDDPDKAIHVSPGQKLLAALAGQKIFVPSACGGGGTCGQCRLRILEGGGDILPTERDFMTRKEIREGMRLSCQVAVKQNMKIEVPPEVFDVKKWECTVRSNRNVATFIKELVLELPPGEDVNFRAGGYIQIECPPHELSFRQFNVEEHFRADWDRFNLWEYHSKVVEPASRAYSMANYPEEKGIIMLNVRIATPPSEHSKAPPGVMSSYIFNLKPGDRVTISGPYGEFFPAETDAEMVYIGGGAGMAPLRSHIFDLLKRRGSKRKISYWYGARSLREVFYQDEFDRLAAENPNFSWHLALSDPLPEDHWQGPTGFIHQVLYDEYLGKHPAPEDCEYYMCGPPLMSAAVLKMLDELGVERENIYFDDFGI